MISSNDASEVNPSRSARDASSAARPAVDHLHDRRIRLPSDQPDRPVAGHSAQRVDLLAHGRAQPGHGQRAPGPDRLRVDGRGPQAAPHRRPGGGEPVPHRLGHGEDRLLTDERLAQDAREEARRRLVGPPRPDADGGQPDADAVDEAAAGVVGEQELTDRLLRAVAGQRCGSEVLRRHVGQRSTEHRDRGGEDQPRSVPVDRVRGADRLEQCTGAVEVDPVAVVEVGLGLTGDDGGQVEDHVRPAGDDPLRRTGYGQVCRPAGRRSTPAGRCVRFHEVDQAEPADLGVVVQPSVAGQTGDELPADHPGRADHGDVHVLRAHQAATGALLDHCCAP